VPGDHSLQIFPSICSPGLQNLKFTLKIFSLIGLPKIEVILAMSMPLEEAITLIDCAPGFAVIIRLSK